jgi:hypothetical protein
MADFRFEPPECIQTAADVECLVYHANKGSVSKLRGWGCPRYPKQNSGCRSDSNNHSNKANSAIRRTTETQYAHA